MTPAQSHSIATRFTNVVSVEIEQNPRNVYGLRGEIARVAYRGGPRDEMFHAFVDQAGLTYPAIERVKGEVT